MRSMYESGLDKDDAESLKSPVLVSIDKSFGVYHTCFNVCFKSGPMLMSLQNIFEGHSVQLQTLPAMFSSLFIERRYPGNIHGTNYRNQLSPWNEAKH